MEYLNNMNVRKDSDFYLLFAELICSNVRGKQTCGFLFISTDFQNNTLHMLCACDFIYEPGSWEILLPPLRRLRSHPNCRDVTSAVAHLWMGGRSNQAKLKYRGRLTDWYTLILFLMILLEKLLPSWLSPFKDMRTLWNSTFTYIHQHLKAAMKIIRRRNSL